MRVYELARELSLESKEVVAKANEIGIPVRTHMSKLAEAEEQKLRAALTAAKETSVQERAPIPDEDLESVGNLVGPEGNGSRKEWNASDAGLGQERRRRDDRRRRDARRRRNDRRRWNDRRRQGGGLAKNDPFWQFGTPVESWGRSRGGRAPKDPSGLPPDDPYWQFGTPPKTWGSKRRQEQTLRPNQRRRRAYLECPNCGVKLERKAVHGSGKVSCPFCNRRMVLVK